jgi:NAD(P)-dependent dehydrogenase (short-subunit alcohol dehydrogenase family)
MRSTYDVRGRTVLITGAARGIGAAVAERLHAKGANVALVGLEPDLLRTRAEALGSRATWFEADVTDGDAVQAAVDGCASAFGSIDVAIANAGLSFVGALGTQPVEQWVRTIDVNLIGVYRTDRAVLPHLIESGGYLMNIASLSALAHAPLMSAYTASKAGVEAMTDALRIELSVTAATAGTAYFGFIDTDLVRGAYEHPATQAMNRIQPAFLKRPIALSDAVDAIDRGIQRRAARLWAPRFVGAVLALRGAVQPLVDAAMARGGADLAAAVRLADPAHAVGAPPSDPALGVAVQDGVGALAHGSAVDIA